jgi:PKD domain
MGEVRCIATHWRRGGQAALLLTVVLGLAPSAHAAAGWVSPTTLFTAGANAPAQVVVDSAGDTLAVWAQSDGANTRVESAYRPAGAMFSAPLALSAPGENASCPQAAIDSAGDVTVAWLRSDGTNQIAQASYGQAGSALSAPASLSATGEDATCPKVVVSSGGAATVAFTRTDGTNSDVEASWRTTGAFGPAQDVSGTFAASGTRVSVQVVEDQAGDATLAWSSNAGGIQVATQSSGQAPVSAGTRCDPSETLVEFILVSGPGSAASILCSENTENPQSYEIVESSIPGVTSTLTTSSDILVGPVLAVNGRGDAVAAWRVFHFATPSSEGVQAAANPGGASSWGPAVTIDNGANAPGIVGFSEFLTWGPPLASIDASGNSIVAWFSAAGLIESTYQPYGQAFGSSTVLSSLSELASPVPVISRNAAGDTMVAWSDSGGPDNRPEASVAGPGQPLGVGVPMSASGATPSSMAVDPSGDAVMAWTGPDGSNFDTGVTGYEVTPPQLGTVSAPGSGQAGTALSFAATGSSVWSPLTTTWSWGDGGQMTGAEVKHTYAAAGTYKITVTVADQVGNDASTSRSVTISKAPTTFQVTPRPKKGVKAQIVLGWHWLNAWTVVRSITIRRLPKQGRVAVVCLGPKCPRLKMKSATAKNVGKLLKSLTGQRFHAGDRLRVTVTAPRMTTERIQLTIRYNRKPTAKLLKP